MENINFELSEDGRKATITCPDKTKSVYTISKDLSGFIFYDVTVDKGKMPTALSGKFSSIAKAKRAIEVYLTSTKESLTVRRDKIGARVMKEMEDESKANAKGN
jgi:hypothetical protein